MFSLRALIIGTSWQGQRDNFENVNIQMRKYGTKLINVEDFRWMGILHDEELYEVTLKTMGQEN